MKWIAIGTLAAVGIALAALFSYRQDLPTSVEAQSPKANNAPEKYVVPALTKTYLNDEHRFSLSMPEDFIAHETQIGGATSIALESPRGDGVQILVSPFDEDIQALTEDRIRADLPDLAIVEPQTVEIGSQHTGIAFRSDNEEFGGTSREVWFVFRKNLYQISTYEHLDPLLQAIFATWQFN